MSHIATKRLSAGFVNYHSKIMCVIYSATVMKDKNDAVHYNAFADKL